MDYHRRDLFSEENSRAVFVYGERHDESGGQGMSFILKLLGDNVQAGPLQDAGWWGNVGGTAAGVSVGPETAMKLSAVWACVSLLAETVAMLPLVVYKSLPNDQGKEKAKNNPLYDILHSQPNARQTAFEFWQEMMISMLLRGNAYARIVAGSRGFVDALEPIHPDAVVQIDKLKNGRLRYLVQMEGSAGGTRWFSQDEIFHVRGLSMDGMSGVSVVTYARESMGVALAAEGYGGRFFKNDSRPGGVLSTEKKLTTEAAKRLKQSWEAAHSGGNQHRVAVLEEGMVWQQIGITPQDAQYLETREFQAEDICRWFRVPPHMVGLTSKATSWGSGIEQLGIGYVTYTLLPWLTRITQAITRDLILYPDRYFADFVVEGLLRGNLNDRYNAYSIGIQWGFMSPNDVRHFENMNSREGGDAYLTPLNMSPSSSTGSPSTGSGSALSPALSQREREQGHYRMLAEEAAGRLVRKEAAAVTRIYEKEGDVATAVAEFYASHVSLVAQTMRMSLEDAGIYCIDQRAMIVERGGWFADEVAIVGHLADLAVGSWT